MIENPLWTEPADAAANGARWFDQREPGWHWDVDVARLNIADDDDCALAQVYGEPYSKAIVTFALEHEDRVRLGFAPTIWRWSKDMPALNAAWREEIAKRRLAEGGGVDEPPRVMAAEDNRAQQAGLTSASPRVVGPGEALAETTK